MWVVTLFVFHGMNLNDSVDFKIELPLISLPSMSLNINSQLQNE